jgi:hypothetical protein
MDEYNITYALGNYVINPLPDVKEEGGEYYSALDDFEEITPYKLLTIQEIKKQAALDAMRIFDIMYKNNKFLILPGDSDGSAILGYSEYIELIENNIIDLDNLEVKLMSIINGYITDETPLDYTYIEFENDITSE